MAPPPTLLERLGAWGRRTAAAALSAGGTRPVPRHVAFIMDGNRRYAEARRLRKAEGHAFGYARLLAALEWCLDLGVACVSVYAFSIDNYRRSEEEVATLMALAQDKLAHLLQECTVLERHGVRVRVVGDLSLAPPGVRAAAAAVEAATAHHSRATLNLCFSYTASEELQRALDGLGEQQQRPQAQQQPQQQQQPLPPQQWEAAGSGGAAGLALDRALYTAGCPPVDLLVRTSGEMRLSDFLLWQSRHALLVFTDVLWPDFGFLDLVAAVQQYQAAHPHLQRLRAAADAQVAAVAAAAAAAVQAAPAASQAAAAAAAAAAPVAQAAPQPAARQQELQPLRPLQQQQQQQLPPIKLPAGGEERLQRVSPCSIASPASPSSPSSRSGSEGAEEVGAAAAAAAIAAALAAAAPLDAPLRHRHLAAAGAEALL